GRDAPEALVPQRVGAGHQGVFQHVDGCTKLQPQSSVPRGLPHLHVSSTSSRERGPLYQSQGPSPSTGLLDGALLSGLDADNRRGVERCSPDRQRERASLLVICPLAGSFTARQRADHLALRSVQNAPKGVGEVGCPPPCHAVARLLRTPGAV